VIQIEHGNELLRPRSGRLGDIPSVHLESCIVLTGGPRPAGAAIGGVLENDSVWWGYMQAIGPHQELA
jgi:hypothetical protein